MNVFVPDERVYVTHAAYVYTERTRVYSTALLPCIPFEAPHALVRSLDRALIDLPMGNLHQDLYFAFLVHKTYAPPPLRVYFVHAHAQR